MLFLPLLGICATAIFTIFLPFIKDIPQPAISLLHGLCQSVFDGVKYHLGITGDVGHIPPPYVPLPSLRLRVTSPLVHINSSRPWRGPKGYILLSTESSLSVIPRTETALTLVPPFQVTAPKHWLSSPFPAAASSSSSSPPSFSSTRPSVQQPSISGPPDLSGWIPLVVLLGFLVILSHGILMFIYSSVNRKEKKQLAAYASAPTPAASANKSTQTPRDLTNTKVIFPLQKKEPYLDGFIKKIEPQPEPIGTSEELDLPLSIIEYLYVEEKPAPSKLISINRWSITRSEYDSTYVWSSVPRSPVTSPSTVVSKYLFTKQTENAKKSIPPASPIGPTVDSHVGGPSGTNQQPETTPVVVREEPANPSTVVADCHVEKTPNADVDVKQPPSSSSSSSDGDGDGVSVPGREDDAGETSTVVLDRHVEGTSVVEIPFGRAPESAVVAAAAAAIDDDAVVNKEEQLPPPPPPTLSQPVPRLEPGEDAVPTTGDEDQQLVAAKPRHRRRNRMGQRQRRKRREEYMKRMAEEEEHWAEGKEEVTGGAEFDDGGF